jgi:manganese/zinc/iron transport system substrate-binding protein
MLANTLSLMRYVMSGRVSRTHVIWFSLLALSGCYGTSSADGDGSAGDRTKSGPQRIRIVATTGMVADMVRHVAGERGDVQGLIGSGVDPHLFKATRHDIKQLQEAEVVFYSGLMLEGRMQDALRQVDSSRRPVVAVTDGLDKDFLRSPAEFEGHFDPHVWMDVAAWSRCVDRVVETLATFDSAHAEEFRQNAKAYQSELTQLDDYVRGVIESIPAPQRVLVTAHDAFGYFGRAYGIEVRSVQGVTTESEAGVHDVNRLVDFLVARKLPAIFVESSVNEKNIRAVIEGTDSRHVTVRVGGELFSDAMGVEGTYEGTYIGMLDHNATRIARALGGAAPEKGLHGKLGNGVTRKGSVPLLAFGSLSALIGLSTFAAKLRGRRRFRRPMRLVRIV